MSKRKKPENSTRLFAAGYIVTLAVMLMWLRSFGEILPFAIGIYLVFFGCISLIVMTAFFLRLYLIESQVVSSVLNITLGITIAFTAGTAPRFFPEGNLMLSSAIFLVASLVLFFVYYSFYHRQRSAVEPTVRRNLTSAAVMIVLALICVLGRAVFGETGTFARVILTIGAAYYMMTQMYNYFVFVSESHARKGENKELSRIAYEDALTGLYNRACWDEKMNELDRQDDDYCIISLDLDGLKTINDTKGHLAGDRLIVKFAEVLYASFPDPCFAARIGGDEFCVIIEGESEEEVKERLEAMEKGLEELDRKERGINHRCSYGYALSEGVAGAKSHNLYLDADAKMYEMKTSHKAENKVLAAVMEESNESKVASFVQDAFALLRGERKDEPPARSEEPVRREERAQREEPVRRDAPVQSVNTRPRTGGQSAYARQQLERERAVQNARQIESMMRQSRQRTATGAPNTPRTAQEQQEAKEKSIAKALDVLKEAQEENRG